MQTRTMASINILNLNADGKAGADAKKASFTALLRDTGPYDMLLINELCWKPDKGERVLRIPRQTCRHAQACAR